MPEPIDEAAQASPGFRWAAPEIGRRHKLGGSPDFLQPAEWPSCPSCGKDMQFWAQVDSIDDAHAIADVGMIFVFMCDGCFETVSFAQSG